MTIRAYNADDKQACIAIFKSNMPNYFASSELTDFESWLDNQDKNTEENGDLIQYFVVELNEQLVACGGFYINKNKLGASMTWGMVDSTLHKHGIGRRFLKYRIAAIKTINKNCIITLDTTQYSYPFFEKMGFEVIKVTKDFYSPGLDRYDMKIE